MKILKVQPFSSEYAIGAWIARAGIPREDIQQLLWRGGDSILLFYWQEK